MLNQQLSPRCPSPLLPILPITGVCSCRSYKIVRLNHPRASGIIPDVSERIPYLQNCAPSRQPLPIFPASISPSLCVSHPSRYRTPAHCVSPSHEERSGDPAVTPRDFPRARLPSPLSPVAYWPVCADARLISMDARPFGGPSRYCPAVFALDQGRERRRNGGRDERRVPVCDLAQFPLFLSRLREAKERKCIFLRAILMRYSKEASSKFFQLSGVGCLSKSLPRGIDILVRTDETRRAVIYP